MPTARSVAASETAEYPEVAARLAARDPIEALVERMLPQVERSADALQVAAALEAAGVTDQTARVRFGFGDVFELAEELRRRVDPSLDPYPRPAEPPQPTGWRDILHGAMYLIAAAIFPPAVAALGRSASLVAIVLTAAVGWVLSGVTSWLAYRLLGDGQPGAANRLLRRVALSAVPLGAATAGVVAVITNTGLTVVLLAAAMMAYQMAVTVLVVYRREALVFAAMGPAVVTGIAYLVIGPALGVVAVATAVASVAVASSAALSETGGRGAASVRLRKAIHTYRRRLLWVLAFTALSAGFVLYPQAPHLSSRPEITVAVLPLIAGMGVVEWRARRFLADARALLLRVTHPRQFAARIWLVVLTGLGQSAAVVGVLAGALLGVLSVTGHASDEVTAMAVAGVLLASAFFLGFLLANLGRYGWLCSSLLLGLATYEVVRSVLPGSLGTIVAFQIAAAALLLLYAAGLFGFLGEARRHR